MTTSTPKIRDPKSLEEEEKQSLSEDETLQTIISESSKEIEFSPENRFFADSPYYDDFVENGICSAEGLYTTFKDIGAETESFSRASKVLLKALNSLSSTCRKCCDNIDQGTDQARVKKVPEIGMLQALGEALEEISASHKCMFDMIEVFLGYQLMELSVRQMAIINKLREEKREAELQTRHSEQEICNYLNGKNAAGNSNKSTDPAHLQDSMLGVPNHAERRWSLEVAQRKSHDFRWSQRICMEETTAELKRFKLAKNIVDANYERRLELSRGNREVLQAMHNCFQSCLDKVTEIIPYVDKYQRPCSDYHNKKKALWEIREKSLGQTLTRMKTSGEISFPHSNTEGELIKIERDAQIWDLPYKLASVLKFYRSSPQDILMEGWLYQKCSSMMSLQSSWVRRWFILKSSGIYYLEFKAEGRKSETNNSTANSKVKLFDLILCTVKELPNKPSARFCFELISPCKKTIILQARGPKELHRWLNRIRSAVESELAKVNPQIESTEMTQISSEYCLAVPDRRKPWNIWDRQSSVSDLSDSLTISEEDFVEDPLIIEVLKANPKCADCGAYSPDWVSLNLGILVCLECSGVHRSLGCHLSKVRSLTLDKLSNSEASLLLSLGNERANKIWEREMTAESKALKEVACTQDRKAREEWIRSKYVKKEYVGGSSNISTESKEKLSRELYAASKRGDVIGVATALAHGANLDWRNDEEDGPCTALAVSIMQKECGKNGAMECAELLYQHGAKESRYRGARAVAA